MLLFEYAQQSSARAFDFANAPLRASGEESAKPGEDWERLYAIDPARAGASQNDQYRIEHALEIYYTTGIKPSEHWAALRASEALQPGVRNA